MPVRVPCLRFRHSRPLFGFRKFVAQGLDFIGSTRPDHSEMGGPYRLTDRVPFRQDL